MSWKKDKRTLILLIPAVLAVWGIIAWRVMDGLQVAPANHAVHVQPKGTTEKKQAKELSYAYNEPFELENKRVVRRASTLESAKKVSPKKVEKPMPVVAKPWPVIAYLGMIKNLSTKKHTAILQQGTQTEMVGIGQVWSEFKVLKCEEDSVQLQFEKEKKWLRKKK